MTKHKIKLSEFKSRAENLLTQPNLILTPDSSEEIRAALRELDTYRIELELQNEELLNTQQRMQEVYQDYQNLYDYAPVAYVSLDDNCRILTANATFMRLLGLSGQPILNKLFTDFVLDCDQDILYLYRQSLFDESHPAACEIRLKNPLGQLLWVKCEGVFNNIFLKTHQINFVLTDITLLKSLEEDLRLGASIFDQSEEAIMITDAGQSILKVNCAFSDITGYAAGEAVGQKVSLLLSDKQDKLFYEALWATIAAYDLWQGELWCKRKSGEIYPVWLTLSAKKNAENTVTHYIGIGIDITKRKDADNRIHFMAYFDALTELPNRTLLQDRIKIGSSRSLRTGHYNALMLLDLDHFKVINDSLGHDVGDNLLIEVARRLTASIREEDTVSRLGGDEFVILLQDLSLDQEDAELKAAHIAEKILKKLEVPILFESHHLHITASIGVRIFSGDAEDVTELTKQADNALYKAKDAGRNNYQFFTSEMKTHADTRLVMENGLRQSLGRGELSIYYQPQINIEHNRIFAAEALLRWVHPDKGIISPASFIPIAEQTRLILRIGAWVLNSVCLQIAELNAVGLAHPLEYIAVNVSPLQFQQADFVDKVIDSITEAGINPQQLELELTESMLMHTIDDTLKKLQTLKAFGVRIAIDDFGMGYSSLSYLKRFPLDVLKIDHSFVQDVTSDPSDAAIVQTIIALADNLQLRVMAEGVETEAQLAFLREKNCYAYQGYLCSPPLPYAAFLSLLTHGKVAGD